MVFLVVVCCVQGNNSSCSTLLPSCLFGNICKIVPPDNSYTPWISSEPNTEYCAAAQANKWDQGKNAPFNVRTGNTFKQCRYLTVHVCFVCGKCARVVMSCSWAWLWLQNPFLRTTLQRGDWFQTFGSIFIITRFPPGGTSCCLTLPEPSPSSPLVCFATSLLTCDCVRTHQSF